MSPRGIGSKKAGPALVNYCGKLIKITAEQNQRLIPKIKGLGGAALAQAGREFLIEEGLLAEGGGG